MMTGLSAECRAEDSKEIEAKVALESSIEARLQTVLKGMLGSQDVIVIANAELAKNEDADREVLPGVPRPQNPAAPGALGIGIPDVRRLIVTILLDQSATDQDVQTVREVSAKLLGLDPRKADEIVIQKFKFQKGALAAAVAADVPGAARMLGSVPAAAKEAARPSAWLSLLWLVLAAAGMVLAYRRFLSPLLSLLRDMISLRQKTPPPEPGEEDDDEPRPAAPVQQAPPIGAAPPAAADGRGDPDLPFSFIGERDSARLIYLLRRSDAGETAVVLHYIPAALGSRVLAALEPAARRKVAELLAAVHQYEESDVRPLEESIKKRIGYLVGGEDKIADLLDQLPPSVQSDLLETLSEKDRDLKDRLSKRLVMLEDLGALDPADLKLLSRRVPVQTLAAVLRPAPELQHSILPKLSEGLRDWLTQEIELSAGLPPDALDSERRRVLNALSLLVREGRVALRKNSARGSSPRQAEEAAKAAPPGSAADAKDGVPAQTDGREAGSHEANGNGLKTHRRHSKSRRQHPPRETETPDPRRS